MADEDSDQQIHWQPVLDAMYKGGHVQRAGDDNDWQYEIFHPMGKLTDLPHEEMQKALSYMAHTGLMSVGDPSGRVSLTERGLQIGHERETTREDRRLEKRQVRRQNKVNGMLAGFTLILAFSSLIQAIAVGTQIENTIAYIFLAGVVIALLVVAYRLAMDPAGWYEGLGPDSEVS